MLFSRSWILSSAVDETARLPTRRQAAQPEEPAPWRQIVSFDHRAVAQEDTAIARPSALAPRSLNHCSFRTARHRLYPWPSQPSVTQLATIPATSFPQRRTP